MCLSLVGAGLRAEGCQGAAQQSCQLRVASRHQHSSVGCRRCMKRCARTSQILQKKSSVNTCMRRQCMRIGLHSQSQYNQQYLPPADGSEHMRSDIRLLAHGLPPLERLLDGSLLGSLLNFRLYTWLSLPSTSDMAAIFHAAHFAALHSSAKRAVFLVKKSNPRHFCMQHNTPHRTTTHACMRLL